MTRPLWAAIEPSPGLFFFWNSPSNPEGALLPGNAITQVLQRPPNSTDSVKNQLP
jgi:hypothetical protein